MHDDLWRFACELYARPGMEPACMMAQAAGSEVCLALCALWLEQRRVEWTPARAQALEDIALPWAYTAIKPLRALRQQWRALSQDDNALGALRREVKQLELEAEQVLLSRLQAAVQAWPQGHPGALRWLAWAVPDEASQAALRAAAGA